MIQHGMTRRARRTTAAGLVSVVALAAMGCTNGGDDGESLTIDDGGDAAAAIAGAVEDARAGSGRYETSVATTTDYGNDDGTMEWTVAGAFSGDSSTSTWRTDGSQVDGMTTESFEASTLTVDGRTYASASSIRRIEALVDEMADEMGDDVVSDLQLSEGGGAYNGPYSDWDFSVLDGKDWVDSTGLDPDDTDLDPLLASYAAEVPAVDPFAVLDAVTDVRDLGAEDLDGTPAQHFTATVPDEALLALLFGDAGTQFDDLTELDGDTGEVSDEEQERQDRQDAVDRYVDEHTTVTADLYLDADDQLLQVRVTATTDIEDQYDECPAVFVLFDRLTMSTVFTDMGGDVVIDAPDPATVVSLDELAAAFPNPSDGESGTTETTVVSGFDAETGEPVMLETVDGPRFRHDVLNDLEKFGYVIGLGVDPFSVAPSERSMRPEVWELSDEELIARYAELATALAAQPHTTTTLGELTRAELLWNVKWGLESIGDTDPASADAFSDAELGALIDGYVDQNGGPVGDGVFGSLPEGVYDGGSGVIDQEHSIEDEFEGCPT